MGTAHVPAKRMSQI